jgi:hypothetical protein
MAALGASETAFWSLYGAQIDARSVACTPFQTVSLGTWVNKAIHSTLAATFLPQ